VPALVVTDVATALGAVAEGTDVVLLAGADDAAGALEAAAALPAGAGRLAVLVGDPGGADDLDAAVAMAAEVFGRPDGRPDPGHL
jgi:3-hydroxy-3-methylglutaryl CoA synthase